MALMELSLNRSLSLPNECDDNTEENSLFLDFEKELDDILKGSFSRRKNSSPSSLESIKNSICNFDHFYNSDGTINCDKVDYDLIVSDIGIKWYEIVYF